MQKRSIQTCSAQPAWLMRKLMPCLIGLIVRVPPGKEPAPKEEKKEEKKKSGH